MLDFPFHTTTALYALVMGLVVWYFGSRRRKPAKFPPGPRGFPILGHLPLLGYEPHKTAIRWLPKYGPIVGIDLASFPCVIISDYNLAKRAFANPAMCGRPKLAVFARRSGGEPEGLGFTSGKAWVQQRHFISRQLRSLGSGANAKKLESAILEKVDELVGRLRSSSSRPNKAINTHCWFNIAFFNTLWGLIAGEPFKQTDPALLHFTRLVVDGFADVNIFTTLSMFMPWFANHFPSWLTRDESLDGIFAAAGALIQPYIDEHWQSRQADAGGGGEPRGLIDAYIDEIEAAVDLDSSLRQHLRSAQQHRAVGRSATVSTRKVAAAKW